MNPNIKLHEIPEDPKDRPYELKLFHEILDDATQLIDDRRKGKVTSFRTPWQGLNKAGVGGLEWNSLLTIGARPGAGKTMIVAQLLREARQLNPTQQFNILEFQFEMGSKAYGAREFAASMAKDYNYIMSVDDKNPLDDVTFKLLKQLREEHAALADVGIIRGIISKPLTASGIEDAVKWFYEKTNGKPMIVTIDHSWLIKKDKSEREKIEVLYNTAEMIMALKNRLPIIFIMLTQLNRVMDEAARKTPGSIANYPTSSDIFGGDALMQASDMVMALNNPFKAGIRSYGPKQYNVGEDDIFMHLLKIRNGKLGDGLLFMKAQFDRGRLIETAEPYSANPTGAPAKFRTNQGPNGNLSNVNFNGNRSSYQLISGQIINNKIHNSMFQTGTQQSKPLDMRELKRVRTEEARDYHQEFIDDLGIDRKDFNIKMAFYDKKATQVVGIFDSEFKKEKGFYFELVDREYLPLEQDRKIYRVPFNEHYAEEYELNEKGSYLVPLSEIREVSKQSVALNKSAAVEPLMHRNLDNSQLSKAPERMEDLPYNDMTIRDFMAIHTGKPVSAKPWLNELIKQTYSK